MAVILEVLTPSGEDATKRILAGHVIRTVDLLMCYFFINKIQ